MRVGGAVYHSQTLGTRRIPLATASPEHFHYNTRMYTEMIIIPIFRAIIMYTVGPSTKLALVTITTLSTSISSPATDSSSKNA